MKINGEVNLQGNKLIDGCFEHLDEYPQNPKVGSWAFINTRLMLCVDKDGTPTWVPITQERNTKVVPQETVSDTWVIEHSLKTTTVIIQCYDAENNVINPSRIQVVDENTTEVTFSDPVAGKAIVMYGYEDGGLTEGDGVRDQALSGMPIGMLADFPSRSAVAEGFLALDGQTIQANEYPELVKLLGGESATEVTLPDINGQRLFYRGGANDTFPFGLKQGDAIRNIVGTLQGRRIPDLNGNGAFRTGHDSGEDGVMSVAQKFSNRLEFDASRVVPTAEENRPVNTSVVRCIKAQRTQIVGEEVDVESLKNRIAQLETIHTTEVANNVGDPANVTFTKVGKVVTMHWQIDQARTVENGQSIVNIPEGYRPTISEKHAEFMSNEIALSGLHLCRLVLDTDNDTLFAWSWDREGAPRFSATWITRD